MKFKDYHHHHLSILYSTFTAAFAYLCCQLVPVSSYGPILQPTLRCSYDSRDVNACWNRYMEVDFMQLSKIMYPKGYQNYGDCRDSAPKRQRSRNDNPLEAEGTGPVFFENCQKLHGIYDCLDEELKHCDEIFTFFTLRHLLYTLKKIILWLCGKPAVEGSETSDDNTHDEIESRFLVLLHSAQCLECFRTSDRSPCHQQENKLIADSHLWLQILRLQVGPEICAPLKVQFQCFQNEDLQSKCDIANNVHTNLTQMFIHTWCDQHPFLPSGSSANSHIHKHTLSLNLSRSLGLVFLSILFNYRQFSTYLHE